MCQAKIHDVHDVLSICVHIVQCYTHLHIIAALNKDGEWPIYIYKQIKETRRNCLQSCVSYAEEIPTTTNWICLWDLGQLCGFNHMK
jgi:hypothetical protein